MKEVTEEKLKKYFAITGEALEEAKKANVDGEEIIDMAQRYFDDAHFFHKKGDDVNAFAALAYAHGWLDCGATLGKFKVSNNRLFTVDEK